MNIEYYKNFVKIAELGNISLAAKALLIAQPSLSKQIQTLEKDFGTALLKKKCPQCRTDHCRRNFLP